MTSKTDEPSGQSQAPRNAWEEWENDFSVAWHELS